MLCTRWNSIDKAPGIIDAIDGKVEEKTNPKTSPKNISNMIHIFNLIG